MGRDLNITCLSPRDEKFAALRAEYAELHAKLPPGERNYHAQTPEGKRCCELWRYFYYTQPHELADDYVDEDGNPDATLEDMSSYDVPKGFYRHSLPEGAEECLADEESPAARVDVSKLPPNCYLIITYS